MRSLFISLLLVSAALSATAKEYTFNGCMKMAATIAAQLTYATNDGNKTVPINLSSLKVDNSLSSCNSGRDQELVLSFQLDGGAADNTLTFVFANETPEGNPTGFLLRSARVHLTLDDKNFPGHKDATFDAENLSKGDGVIRASSGHSFICWSPIELALEDGSFSVTLTDLLVQAFTPNDTAKWLDKEECDGESWQWRVTDKDGHTCILVDTNATVAVKYMTNESKLSEFISVPIKYPKVTGHCNVSSGAPLNLTGVQQMVVQFAPEHSELSLTAWQLTLWFTDNKNHTDGKAYALYHIDLLADYKDDHLFPGHLNTTETFSSPATKSFGGIVGAANGSSSQCSNAELEIAPNVAKLQLNSYRVQAYAVNSTFGPAQMCEKDVRTSDIVPIVVGACLAALVIVVLVAYLIGRARAKRQGYASV